MKFFRKKQEVLSSHMVVRPRSLWHHRILAFIIVSILLALWSWGVYEAGSRSLSVNNEKENIQEQLNQLFDPGICIQTKKQKLCTQIGDLIQQLQISNTANKNLAEQTRSLASENDKLQEKLAFFQQLISGTIKNGVSIYQFSLKETPTPGRYLYTLTVTQGGERPSDFSGKLRFNATLIQNNQTKIIPLINKGSSHDFPINFKFFHRLERNFKVPPDTSVINLQVHIFGDDDQRPILSQTVQPTL